MCGIIGYIGPREATSILINGLKRLEYRGYDSAGLAVLFGKKIICKKVKGKISSLESALKNKPLTSNLGIAHTRWATHGIPNKINAHPHTDCTNKIAIVHNGIIENFATLKKILESKGHRFKSDTDSEILAHLIEQYCHNGKKPLEKSVSLALREVEGAYALAVISEYEPEKIVAARKGSPLVIGISKNNEYLIASDASAIVEHTKNIIYLDDNEIVTITPNKHRVIENIHQNGVDKKIETINWNLDKIEKQGFNSFMLKEIFEQPESIANAMRGRIIKNHNQVKFGGLEEIESKIKQTERIIIPACGTSWHAGLISEYIFEELAQIPVEVEYASEFRYRNPVIESNSLCLFISQSGETADVLAALELAKQKQALCFGICNVVGSTIARAVDAGIYLHAGPEIGVASTKAFTSQLTVLTLLAVYFANLKKTLTKIKIKQILSELEQIPAKIQLLLKQNQNILDLSKKFANSTNFLYLGRGYNFPIALEGALKLKEISYIHAEGYPAAEMKHGPIALIDKKMPVVFIAPQDSTYNKIVSNILEVKARGGQIIVLATTGDKKISQIADHIIYIPKTINILSPILNTVPLQLLAYHIARLKNCDVDKPRNLAKSVTVE